jgi:alcohol/geraniol dehydrogenase (NADP+)
MSIRAYAALGPGEDLTAFEYDPAPLGPQDIELAISHCGICHTDVHLIQNDWGFSQFPLVPGHEIVGTVTAIGREVRRLSEGQRVGVGYESGSCGQCEFCTQDAEHLCLEMKGTCVNGYGGFADRLRVKARFAMPIPDGLAAEIAAPMLCGGITVYTPFHVFDVRAGMRVGVVGIGGLGHLALQFARSLGYEVTAFSTSPDKEAEARTLGAHEFINSRDPEQMQRVANSFDFILCTVSADLPWIEYLAALKPRGKLCIVGVPVNEVHFPAFPVILGQKTICGSPIGSPSDINRMLGHAVEAGVKSQIELFPMDQVNSALRRVRNNEARYRVVLAN